MNNNVVAIVVHTQRAHIAGYCQLYVCFCVRSNTQTHTTPYCLSISLCHSSEDKTVSFEKYVNKKSLLIRYEE